MLVHRPASIAEQVDRHVGETCLADRPNNFRCEVGVDDPQDVFREDLDARDAFVRPNPHDPEPERANRVFRRFDPMQLVQRNDLPMRDARRKASVARLVVKAQSQPLRERSDV